MSRRRSLFVSALTSVWLALASCVVLPSMAAAAAPTDGVEPAAAATPVAVLPPRGVASARRGATLEPCVLPPRRIALRPIALRVAFGAAPRHLRPAVVSDGPRARAPPLG